MTKRFFCAVSVLALVSACSDQPGPSALGPVDQAHSAMLAGNYGAAEQVYDNVLAAAPGNPRAMLGLAEVYEQTGRTGEAAGLYRQVHAARSGDIRVWNDGRMMQDGVTEVAARRLGALGHGQISEFANPMGHEPMAYPETISTGTLPGEPTYALDDEGIVYFADPEATQPIAGAVYETPEAAMGAASIRTTMPAPSYVEPTYAPQPMVTQPTYTQPAYVEPMRQTYTQPAYVEPMQPTYTQPAYVEPMQQTYTQPAYVEPTYAAPTPIPAAINYTAAPIPVANPRANILPAPVLGTEGRQPGYAVVDGNFVYVSAEDIAAGATAPTPPPGAAGAEGYGVPIPVSGSGIPTGTPNSYSAPRGVDVMNGIPIRNF